MITLAQILIQVRTFKRQAGEQKHWDTVAKLDAIEVLLNQYIEEHRNPRATVPVVGEVP